MKLTHVKSTFPVSVGATVTGVDNKTFSVTGEAFSTIVPANSERSDVQTLQADDVSLGACPARVHLDSPRPLLPLS